MNPKRCAPDYCPTGNKSSRKQNNPAKGIANYMLIGAMNHPARSLTEQIEWLGKMGFGFLDLTLEPPHAASSRLDAPAIKQLLEHSKLRVVGHTAPFLPIASPVEELRQAALFEFRRCIDVFQRVGVQWMNVHPGMSPMHDRAFTVERNLESLRELLSYGRQKGVGIMIENLPDRFNTADQLSELLDSLPDLGLHLDIGHANLMTPVNTTTEILAAHGDRLKHVHLHDNRGGNLDLHLPLGAGNIDLAGSLRALKSCGYDGTITLEVFAADLNHLLYSRDLLQQTWAACGEDLRKQHASR
jgi:sugar phosphate isomerase/epimerase